MRVLRSLSDWAVRGLKLTDKLGLPKGGAIAALLLILSLLVSLFLKLSPQTGGTSEIAKLLSKIEGAGRVEVYISAEDGGAYDLSAGQKAIGAVVVAEGAYDIAVSLKLRRAVQVLCSLPYEAVEIYLMGGDKTQYEDSRR